MKEILKTMGRGFQKVADNILETQVLILVILSVVVFVAAAGQIATLFLILLFEIINLLGNGSWFIVIAVLLMAFLWFLGRDCNAS